MWKDFYDSLWGMFLVPWCVSFDGISWRMLWRDLEEGFQVPLWGMFLVSWWFLFQEMLEDLVEGSCGKILRFRCGGMILVPPWVLFEGRFFSRGYSRSDLFFSFLLAPFFFWSQGRVRLPFRTGSTPLLHQVAGGYRLPGGLGC